MDTKPQEIVRGRKFEQVLQGAKRVFMRDGFERASVDDIAREAGVSKATLYAYFPDKRLLFMEIATTECQRQADDAMPQIDTSAPMAEVLTRAATRIFSAIHNDFGRRIYQIAVAEADNFPAFAAEFYCSGPKLVQDRLAELLQIGVARGELEIDDVPFAAAQFAQLIKAEQHDRLVFGISKPSTRAEADKVVNSAVQMFMARYGAKR